MALNGHGLIPGLRPTGRSTPSPAGGTHPRPLGCPSEPLRCVLSTFPSLLATTLAQALAPHANRIISPRVIIADQTPLPVVAIVEATKETFAGELEGETLLIRSDGGPQCTGRVRVEASGYAFGNLRCTDGRFGNFRARLFNGRGAAYGTLGGSSFTLAIG